MSGGRTREGGVPMRERSSQFIARGVIFASDRAAGLGRLDLCVAIRASLRSMVAARKCGSSGEQRSGRFSGQQSPEMDRTPRVSEEVGSQNICVSRRTNLHG